MTGYFDGASRGNPGKAGAGACIAEDGEVIWECAEYLGVKTNNEAEYSALIFLLKELRERKLSEIEIKGDSKLVISQVRKEWKINMPHLKKLAEEAWKLMEGMKIKLSWIPRRENGLADALSNKAIDNAAQ